MNNLELKYTPYSTRLRKPFLTSGITISERTGFILILKSESKSVGIGEVAPLPEFGSETYEQAEGALQDFNLKLRIDLGNIEESIEYNLKDYNQLPSVKCGIELAILKLLCSERKTSIPDLLKRSPSRLIFVNGVIGLLHYNKAVKTAQSLVKKGFKCLKIKVGRKDFDEDLKTISEIRKAVDYNIKLRIDANAIWNKKEAADYINKLDVFDLQYVEQPVKDLSDFILLKDKIKIPLAADESIRSIDDAEKYIINKAVSFLILKPMMLGGIIPCLKIADLAKENNIQTVITSSFEGIIGRIGAVNAAAIVNNDLAHGLATTDYFEEENIPDPFPVTDGKISFEN